MLGKPERVDIRQLPPDKIFVPPSSVLGDKSDFFDPTQIQEQVRREETQPLQFGTRVKVEKGEFPQAVVAKPGEEIIEQVVISEFEDPVTGQMIPIIETRATDERGNQRVLSGKEVEKLFPGQVIIPDKKKGLEGIEQQIVNTAQRLEQRGGFVAQAGATGLGVTRPFIQAGIFFETLAKRPIETIKSVPSGIKSSIKNLKTVGPRLRSSPSFLFGQLAGQALLARVGIKSVSRAIKVGTKLKTLEGVTSKLKVTTKGKGKVSTTLIESFEPGFKKLVKDKRITERRQFEIDIPNPQGKSVKLVVLEYFKNGKSKFVGEVLEDGKVTEKLTGITQAGEKGGFTKVVQARLKKRGFKQIEIKELQSKNLLRAGNF